MEYIFLEDCAADGCKKKNIGNGKQMCKKHQEMYDSGIPFKAFYGKTVLKTEFQNKQKGKANKCAIHDVTNRFRALDVLVGCEESQQCFLHDVSKSEPSCETCIYYSSAKMCKTCDEDWSEYIGSVC